MSAQPVIHMAGDIRHQCLQMPEMGADISGHADVVHIQFNNYMDGGALHFQAAHLLQQGFHLLVYIIHIERKIVDDETLYKGIMRMSLVRGMSFINRLIYLIYLIHLIHRVGSILFPLMVKPFGKDKLDTGVGFLQSVPDGR